MNPIHKKATDFLEYYFEDDELNSPFASKEMIVEALIKLLEDHKKTGPYGCRCQTLKDALAGDGCDICNPELAKELSKE